VFKIVHKENGGFGSAIKKGISIAKNEYIICIPADSPLDEQTAKSFFEAHLKSDIVVSYRLERKGYSKWMLLNSKVFHFLVSNLFNIKLKDFNWIHLYKTEIFNHVDIQSKGIFMLAEVLVKAKKLKYSFIEIPVYQRQRLTGIATASKPSAVIKTILEMIRLKLGI
jgi:glycosyltransferase involved in cell wall biosynthesis